MPLTLLTTKRNFLIHNFAVLQLISNKLQKLGGSKHDFKKTNKENIRAKGN